MENAEKKPKISVVGMLLVLIIVAVIAAGTVVAFVTVFGSKKEASYGSQKAKVTPEENFTVQIKKEQVEIISYNSEASTVAIPETIEGEKVTSIGQEAFMENSSVHKVLIPDGVEVIGDKAFYYCRNLQYVYIPGTVTEIGLNSFMGNGDNFTVYGEADSYAEEFCEKHSIQFEVDK